MVGEGYVPFLRRKRSGPRSWLAHRDIAYFYGLLAVLVVASVQLFFSVDKGGYFPEQWYWGAMAVAVALAVAALVPGYFSSVESKQWMLAGTLVVLTVVVTASIFWSISPELSFNEAARTAMYTGAFVLLLPAAARWGSLVVDATVFGALLPPAIYGLLQKIEPTSVAYTGFNTLQTDPMSSSTVGYHSTFGMMCAMGALLVVARVGAFRSLRSTPLRALYSATGVLFLVALYFSFSRGALFSLAAGAVVSLVFSKYKFEAMGNLAISGLPALWIVSQARDLHGLVARPVSTQLMQKDGLLLVGPLLKGILLAFAIQILFSLLLRLADRLLPRGVRDGIRIAGTVVVLAGIVAGLVLGAATFEKMGGVTGLESRITANDASLQAHARATDTTQRYTSMSLANRIALWKIAWHNWHEHPLTGTGGDTYQVIYQEEAPANAPPVLHPHSMWMSLLSDDGIFAFLAFAAFSVGCLILAAYNAFYRTRSRRSQALLAGSAAAITAYLVSSSVDWNWYIPASTLPFFALAAVAAGTIRRERRKHSPVAEEAESAL